MSEAVEVDMAHKRLDDTDEIKKNIKLIFITKVTQIQILIVTLFINKRFALNEMFQRNASKFAIDIDQGIYKGKSKVAQNQKRKNYAGFLIHEI